MRIDTSFVDPVRFLSQVDTVIVPSRWEAYGVVGVESRAAGRSILVSAVDGLVEQAETGAGLCMDASTPASIAAAIERFMREDTSRMSHDGRRSVAHQNQSFVREWRNLMASLASPASRAAA